MTFKRETGLKMHVLVVGLATLTVLFASVYYHAVHAVHEELLQAKGFDETMVDIFYGADGFTGRQHVHETLLAKR